MSPRLIHAHYPGRCTDCGAVIEPDDLIGFDRDGLTICVTCRVLLAPDPHGGCPDAGCGPDCPAKIA